MEAARKQVKRIRPEAPGFDIVVMQKVGRITLDDTAEENVVEAAFKVIARSGDEGTFQFHVPDGMLNSSQPGFTASVEVNYKSDVPA